MIGENLVFQKETLEALEKAETLTHSIQAWFCLRLELWGRAELTQAVKQIAQEVLDAHLNPGISEEMITNYLYTNVYPGTTRSDLIIRTSGGFAWVTFALASGL